MNADQNDSEQLRRLLALKRYEIPPPRYFNEFSGRVIAGLTEPRRESMTWLQRLGFDFDLQPAMMCGVGILVCGLLSFGIIGAMQISDPDSGSFAANSFAIDPMTPTFAGVAPMSSPTEQASITPLISRQAASPFNQFALGATPVNFTTFGGN